MSGSPNRLDFVYKGWDGYHQSIVKAVAPLTADQLSFRGSPDMRTVGEVALHIADGRVDWFRRINAPYHLELSGRIASRPCPAPELTDAAALVSWLERTWLMVEGVLKQWTVDDLPESYSHTYQGKVYAVSRQWTIWRILTHDMHHGGQLSELLAMQGILPLELTWLGGHLTEPPLAE